MRTGSCFWDPPMAVAASWRAVTAVGGNVGRRARVRLSGHAQVVRWWRWEEGKGSIICRQ